MGPRAVSRFLYGGKNSEYKAKVKRIFGESPFRGERIALRVGRRFEHRGYTPPMFRQRVCKWLVYIQLR
jgi:hypothetical protein